MKIGDYKQMMAYLTRPEQPKEQVAFLVDDLTPGPLKDELTKDYDSSQESYEEYLQRKALGERPFNAQDGGRANLAIGGGAIEGEDLGTREGYRNPGINTRKDLSKVENYLDEDKFVKLRIENKDKTNKEFADFLNKEGYKPDPKQAEKFSPISIDRRYNIAKKKGLIPEDFVYAGSTASKSIKEVDIKEYKEYIKERFPDKYENVLKLSDEEIKKRISDRRSFIKVQEDDAKREAKLATAREYRYKTSRGLRGEEAQKKYEEYNIEQSRQRRKNLNKYYRNPRNPKSLLWEDLLKRNEQALNKPFSYDKKLPIKRYLDKNETQKIVLIDKQGNKFKYDTLLEDIEKATGKPYDPVYKPFAQKAFLYQENLMPEINKQFGIKPGARDNPFHIQHIEGFQQNPFNVQLTFGDQNLAEARGKLSLQSTFKNILKKEQKSPSYQKGTLYNYNKKKKAINKFYESLGPDIATQIGKKEVGTRTALVDLLDKTKVKIKPEVRERAMTLGAMGDVEMAKDILSKDFQTAKKLFGKYAPQIAKGARQVTKFAVIPELAFGAAFAPLDLAEGRTGKETLLNVATLGMGIPIKDARDRANYVDQFGLKEDLFSAQMKQSGAQYGAPALTESEQLALQKAEEFDTQILQPRLKKTLLERQAASDLNFGTGIMGMANGGRIGFKGGGRQDAESQYGADSVGSYDSSQNVSNRDQVYGGNNSKSDPDDNREQYGAQGQYSRPPSTPSDGGGDNKINLINTLNKFRTDTFVNPYNFSVDLNKNIGPFGLNSFINTLGILGIDDPRTPEDESEQDDYGISASYIRDLLGGTLGLGAGYSPTTGTNLGLSFSKQFNQGGRVGLRYGGDTMGGINDKSISSPGPDRSKVSAQQERNNQAAVREAQAFNQKKEETINRIKEAQAKQSPIRTFFDHTNFTKTLKRVGSIPNYHQLGGYDFMSRFPNTPPSIAKSLGYGYQGLFEGIRSLNPFDNYSFQDAMTRAGEEGRLNALGVDAYGNPTNPITQQYYNLPTTLRPNYATGGRIGYNEGSPDIEELRKRVEELMDDGETFGDAVKIAVKELENG
jgi:hypothetical protein